MCPRHRPEGGRPVWLLFLLGALAFGPIQRAQAQKAAPPASTGVGDRAEADKQSKRGDYLTRKGRGAEAATAYAAAVSGYERAISQGAGPSLYFPLALAFEGLGKSVEAANAYRSFLAAGQGRKSERAEAKRRLSTLMDALGAVTLRVKPAGASIEIAGSQVGVAPLEQSVLLMPGEHALSINAPGYAPSQTTLVVEAGSEATRTFTLSPVEVVVTKPRTAPIGRQRDDGSVAVKPPSKKWLWIGGGTTIALFGAAATTGMLAVRKHSIFDDPETEPAARAEARSDGRALALATDVTLAAAVVASGVTLYYYFSEFRPRAKKERAALVPWLGPGVSGVAFARGF